MINLSFFLHRLSDLEYGCEPSSYLHPFGSQETAPLTPPEALSGATTDGVRHQWLDSRAWAARMSILELDGLALALKSSKPIAAIHPELQYVFNLYETPPK